jgi:hypothetical protein
MGQAAPLEEEGITHGICPLCSEKMLHLAGLRSVLGIPPTGVEDVTPPVGS